jgi:hypothetical protein
VLLELTEPERRSGLGDKECEGQTIGQSVHRM